MNVITMASRKGGAGKSTLTAHLAAYCHTAGHRCLVIDADPQGSITLWHSLRADRQPDLRSGARGIDRALAMAMVEGYEWAFIDTAASMWVVAQEAIRAATLVRGSGAARIFRSQRGARDGRGGARAQQAVCGRAQCRAGETRRQGSAGGRAVAGVFRQAEHPGLVGPVSQRTGYVLTLAAGSSIGEVAPDSLAGAEIAGLWSAIERSVAAINDAHAAATVSHGHAA